MTTEDLKRHYTERLGRHLKGFPACLCFDCCLEALIDDEKAKQLFERLGIAVEKQEERA